MNIQRVQIVPGSNANADDVDGESGKNGSQSGTFTVGSVDRRGNPSAGNSQKIQSDDQ